MLLIRCASKVIKKVETLKYPVIVKPATTGSSVGINVCDNETKLVEAIEQIKYIFNSYAVEGVSLRRLMDNLMANNQLPENWPIAYGVF